MAPKLKNAVVRAGALIAGVLVACPAVNMRVQPPPATNEFQSEAAPMRGRLHAKAQQAIADLPPDTLVIGVLQYIPGGRNNLTYIPSELRFPVGSSARVAWISWDGPFTLTFKDPPGSTGDWPFKEAKGNGEITSTSGNPNWVIRTLDDAKTAKMGRYHFQVKLTVTNSDGTREDVIDWDCPPIIID